MPRLCADKNCVSRQLGLQYLLNLIFTSSLVKQERAAKKKAEKKDEKKVEKKVAAGDLFYKTLFAA